MTFLRVVTLLVSCVLATSAFAGGFVPEEVIFDHDGHKLPDSDVNSSSVAWSLLKLSESHAYSGIGLLDLGGGGGCSATFLDTGARNDNTPAYALTNGHCSGGELLAHDEIALNRPVPRGMNLRLNYFVDAGSAIRVIPVRRILYATMFHTDVALLELDISFRDLVSEGFVPHAIDDKDPRAGIRVEMVGIPQSRISRGTRFIRRSTCEIGARADLREGGYVFRGAFRHGCSSVGGSSGTSMISLETKRIVAINNTGVNDNAMSEPECAINRPCEVARDGSIRTDINSNYAQRVTDFPSCFDERGVFDLGLRDCQLERP